MYNAASIVGCMTSYNHTTLPGGGGYIAGLRIAEIIALIDSRRKRGSSLFSYKYM